MRATFRLQKLASTHAEHTGRRKSNSIFHDPTTHSLSHLFDRQQSLLLVFDTRRITFLSTKTHANRFHSHVFPFSTFINILYAALMNTYDYEIPIRRIWRKFHFVQGEDPMVPQEVERISAHVLLLILILIVLGGVIVEGKIVPLFRGKFGCFTVKIRGPILTIWMCNCKLLLLCAHNYYGITSITNTHYKPCW